MANHSEIPCCELVSEDDLLEDRNAYCSACYKKLITVKCSRCHRAYYCSQEHQQSHWNFHRETCDDNKAAKYDYSNTTLDLRKTSQLQTNEALSITVINQLNVHGYCVIDDFLGTSCSSKVLQQVLNLHEIGVFTDGQLARSISVNRIRGDKVAWIGGDERGCEAIKYLSTSVDSLISLCKGRLGSYVITGRTKVSNCIIELFL